MWNISEFLDVRLNLSLPEGLECLCASEDEQLIRAVSPFSSFEKLCYFSLLVRMRNAMKDFILVAVPHIELLYQIRPVDYLDRFPDSGQHQMTE